MKKLLLISCIMTVFSCSASVTVIDDGVSKNDKVLSAPAFEVSSYDVTELVTPVVADVVNIEIGTNVSIEIVNGKTLSGLKSFEGIKDDPARKVDKPLFKISTPYATTGYKYDLCNRLMVNDYNAYNAPTYETVNKTIDVWKDTEGILLGRNNIKVSISEVGPLTA